MQVEVRKKSDVVIVDMSGRLVAGVGDQVLRDIVGELLAEKQKKILLNLTQVTAIDSAGVGELVGSLRNSRHAGAQIKILNMHERVRKALHLTHILPLFEVFEDEKTAIQHFSAS